MDSSLHVHILFVENKLQELHDSLTSGVQSSSMREQIEAQIMTAACALIYYRQALELESTLHKDDFPKSQA